MKEGEKRARRRRLGGQTGSVEECGGIGVKKWRPDEYRKRQKPIRIETGCGKEEPGSITESRPYETLTKKNAWRVQTKKRDTTGVAYKKILLESRGGKKRVRGESTKNQSRGDT